MLQIDSVFFIEYSMVFTENMLLILGTESFLIQVIVYLKTNTTLHTYRLREKPHCISKNESVFSTGYFSHWPVFDAKGSVIYCCTAAIWSTIYLIHRNPFITQFIIAPIWK